MYYVTLTVTIQWPCSGWIFKVSAWIHTSSFGSINENKFLGMRQASVRNKHAPHSPGSYYLPAAAGQAPWAWEEPEQPNTHQNTAQIYNTIRWGKHPDQPFSLKRDSWKFSAKKKVRLCAFQSMWMCVHVHSVSSGVNSCLESSVPQIGSGSVTWIKRLLKMNGFFSLLYNL